MNFTVTPMSVPDVKLIIGEVFNDHRGSFTEAYREARFAHDFQLPPFVQGNVSVSHKGVARGLHYQVTKPQGKLMRTVHGRTLNIAVDMRAGSATFGGWCWTVLDRIDTALWVPPGFANGFVALEDDTTVAYECSTEHFVGSDRATNIKPYFSEDLMWRHLNLAPPGHPAYVPLHKVLIVSDKDRDAPDIGGADWVPEAEWRAP